jgi:hypothetical protein
MMRAKREAEGVAWGVRQLVGVLACGAAMLGAACSPRSETSIRTAPAEERNALLRQAIRDSGYLCDEVIDATAPAEAAAVWRVLCTDMLVYVASLDAQDAVHIEPIAYGDPAIAPASRNPEPDTETVRPDP